MALKPCLRCGALTSGSYCPSHQPRLRGRRWMDLRERVFAAHGRRCADCGRSDVPLEVHHLSGDPMDNRLTGLVPLCRDCHRELTFPGA